MADIFTANLAGASELFNGLISKLNSVKSSMEAGLEIDPSTLASTLGGDFTSLTSELRGIMPSIPALPNINLQSALTSLSGIDITSDAVNRVANLSRHTTLLNDITSNFNTELSAAGFDLDTLVTNARSRVDLKKTLSGIVPNFVKAADGLTDAFQIADAVKQATADPIKEILSTFTANDSLGDHISEIKSQIEIALIKAAIPDDEDD